VVSDLQIPKLSAYDIHEEHVADLVTKAMNASSMKANPVALTPEELAGTLRQAL
jgi:alcohol dehydrogenase class IV